MQMLFQTNSGMNFANNLQQPQFSTNSQQNIAQQIPSNQPQVNLNLNTNNSNKP